MAPFFFLPNNRFPIFGKHPVFYRLETFSTACELVLEMGGGITYIAENALNDFSIINSEKLRHPQLLGRFKA